jgi:riboflavin biosynthesis pyrimidine reductase
MAAEPSPADSAPLESLLGNPAGRQLTAAQVVEQLRLWDPGGVGPPERSRPRMLLNMVCTADGRATLGGRSGAIGNRADRELFHALRTAVDAVLVGAGTARAERYRRLVKDEAQRRLRRERGLSEEPLACIVSASLALSPDTVPLLADPAARIVVITPSATGELPAATGVEPGDTGEPRSTKEPGGTEGPGDTKEPATTGEVPGRAIPVEYIRAARGDGLLDLPSALAELHTRLGVRTVLCEGGPHLNGALLAAGVVDELFLSLAPKLGGGANQEASRRIVSGPELDPPVELKLCGALESEGCLLLRYSVERQP